MIQMVHHPKIKWLISISFMQKNFYDFPAKRLLRICSSLTICLIIMYSELDQVGLSTGCGWVEVDLPGCRASSQFSPVELVHGLVVKGWTWPGGGQAPSFPDQTGICLIKPVIIMPLIVKTIPILQNLTPVINLWYLKYYTQKKILCFNPNTFIIFPNPKTV